MLFLDFVHQLILGSSLVHGSRSFPLLLSFHVKCSGRCGRGVQYRTVHCTIFNLELNRIFALEPSKCTGNDKPVAVRRCKNEKPCRVRYYVSKWSAVSLILILNLLEENPHLSTFRMISDILSPISFCDSLIYITCIYINFCIRSIKTNSLFSFCFVDFRFFYFSQCSSACDTGISRRNVLCYADRIVDYSQRACAKLARPIDVKLCKNTECK